VLDLDANRPAVAPKDAATIVLLRSGRSGLEIFCVERNKKSRFMGGAVVFPGGKVDEADADDAWSDLVTTPATPRSGFAHDAAHLRALCIAACRETLEEAAILPVAGGTLDDRALAALRTDVASGAQRAERFRAALRTRGLRLDLGALHPLARWITPEAESRRYDTRFFLCLAPEGQAGAHDEHETMASFWAPPSEVLRRFEAGEVHLMPPTHRTLSLLSACDSVEAAVALAAAACLSPIQPQLVRHNDERGETIALVLPGDPEHEVREARVTGRSRFVLRDERWLSEDPPR
jgi:8-oxo-dGTP pyrophosphatase MutT (NUDIX family)